MPDGLSSQRAAATKKLLSPKITRGGQARPLRPAARSRVVDLRRAEAPTAEPAEDIEHTTHRCGGVPAQQEIATTLSRAGVKLVTDQYDAVNSAYVYDPQANAWTQLASMGTARKGPASAAVGGKLYVFGGFGTQRLSTAEVYDPASDGWAPVTSLTSARGFLVAVAL